MTGDAKAKNQTQVQTRILPGVALRKAGGATWPYIQESKKAGKSTREGYFVLNISCEMPHGSVGTGQARYGDWQSSDLVTAAGRSCHTHRATPSLPPSRSMRTFLDQEDALKSTFLRTSIFRNKGGSQRGQGRKRKKPTRCCFSADVMRQQQHLPFLIFLC